MTHQPLHIGIIGGGMIAQVMHIPYLCSLPQHFRIEALCDLSVQTGQELSRKYGIPHTFQDAAEMLESVALDAVLILTPHHYPLVIQALQAGVHIFVEKPMCENLEQAAEIVDIARSKGLIGQVGYHKPYDPGYVLGSEMVQALPNIRLATMHIAHGPNEPFLEHHEILRFQDIGPDQRDAIGQDMRQALTKAIGEQAPHLTRAYGSLLGSGCHQLSIMRGCLGTVQEVLSTEVWNEGRSITAVLAFDQGVRCVFSSVFMPDIRLFNETFTAYNDAESVAIRFPSPFLNNAVTTVTRCSMAEERFLETEMTANYTEAFRNELIHFHHCIVTGSTPRTPLEHGAEDTAVMIEIIRRSPDFIEQG